MPIFVHGPIMFILMVVLLNIYLIYASAPRLQSARLFAEEERTKKPEELSRDQKRKWKASCRNRMDDIWNGKSSWR